VLSRYQHLWILLTCLPGLLLSRQRRALLAEMRRLCRQLPEILDQPLPKAMNQLTPTGPQTSWLPSPELTRKLADLAALLERRTTLGLCLRRSLVRYHYLRQHDLPLLVRFGAKLLAGEAGQEVTGHAWLTLHGQPYFEAEENWRDFRIMFTWPDP
jgi:hypothetical protein